MVADNKSATKLAPNRGPQESLLDDNLLNFTMDQELNHIGTFYLLNLHIIFDVTSSSGGRWLPWVILVQGRSRRTLVRSIRPLVTDFIKHIVGSQLTVHRQLFFDSYWTFISFKNQLQAPCDEFRFMKTNNRYIGSQKVKCISEVFGDVSLVIAGKKPLKGIYLVVLLV